jgi:hypothetical protein
MLSEKAQLEFFLHASRPTADVLEPVTFVLEWYDKDNGTKHSQWKRKICGKKATGKM